MKIHALIVFIAFCFCSVEFTAQTSPSVKQNKYKKKVNQGTKKHLPAQFGISASVIFPNNFVESKEIITQDTASSLSTRFYQRNGYQFGGVIQFQLNRFLGFETGLSQIRRNYDVSVNVPDSAISGNKRLGFVAYDVPINLVVKVKLTNNWSSSTQAGISISHYPSDVRDSVVTSKKQIIQLEGRRIHRTYFSINFATGFDYKLEKGGMFHFGGSIKLPIDPVFIGVGLVKRSGTDKRLFTKSNVLGGFFGLTMSYYLDSKKLNSNKEVTKPIIE